MELHNTVEDIVILKVNLICDTIEEQGDTEKICTCDQCRVDTACYVLNRIPPFYIVSNRGATRVHHESLERQQKETDITVMIYEGLKRVSHNLRPHFSHDFSRKPESEYKNKPVFIIPAISGRILNGNNFAPISGLTVELDYNGALVAMKDPNWQNPITLVSQAEGMFSFWPEAIPAKEEGEHSIFEFTVKVDSPEYEPLVYVFNVPVISEIGTSQLFTLVRSYKLPDLFMFPPGEQEQNRSLD